MQLNDAVEADRIFRALGENSMASMPIRETFRAAGFGMQVDRLGAPWMINGGQFAFA